MKPIQLEYYLIVALILFSLGLMGLFKGRKSILSLFMAIELMLLAVNINLVAFSAYLQDLNGQIYTLFILAVAAAEMGIGLAVLVTFYRQTGSIEIESAKEMKG